MSHDSPNGRSSLTSPHSSNTSEGRSGQHGAYSGFPSVRSTGDLSLPLPRRKRDQLMDGQRSRSHSAPLTMEALVIAKELQKVSDQFNLKYMYRKKGREHRKDKERRKTVAAYQRDSIQYEFDRSIWNEAGYDSVVTVEELKRSSRENILDIPEYGTPV